MVIYSPGGMFDGSLIQNRNLNEVPSKRRNPILADVFTQFGYMEKRGSGLRKICNETAKLPGFSNEKKPTFRSQYESFFTEILNNNYSTANKENDIVDNTIEKATVKTKSKNEDITINILNDIQANPDITAAKLAEKYSVSIRQVYRLLRKLQNDNKIVRVGSDKNGYWKIVE